MAETLVENEQQPAQEYDYHPMWKSLGMNVEDHDMLLGAVGQMYGDMFLTQSNRPKATSYLDFVASNIHSGRIREMLDKKESGEATKIVGSFCLYVPEEVVTAAGGIAVSLCSGADWATDKVEEHLPRNTCPLIKSFTGFKLGHVCPYIESSDLVVGENTCDGKKKAYEYFSTLANMYIVDIPNVHNDATVEVWKGEVKKLAHKIEEFCGQPITAESLAEAIRIANDKRRALQRLSATRAADPAPISGLDSLLTVQAALMDDPVRLTGAVNDMAAECEARVAVGEGVVPKGTKRILYTGTPMAVPNWKFFNIIEKAGGIVVGEESCTGSRYYRDLVDESGTTVDQMLDAIAERYFKISCAVFTPNDQRMADIVNMARDLHADGIIDCSLQFCTLYETEAFTVEKAAEEAGIPFMHVTTDYANEDAGQLTTRVEAFLETI
ncbi:double-cubane-cluster-containing anaerobic reductase [Thermophilibacter immobilis]|uniref:2-hydroxyacyl-CoA dehydratase n=1 Tax=Thermophilibacter immobilis TaxID=2779519 RepID=A0A7S7RTI4_9ACTN|nr:double-cubane-cluster-containing anaerobic reductase [Thermophilibacter immobilis]QOY60241.1 2-hydroxyacyl-CoA dehydratase [Thermophilibacter immobilis]